MRFGLFYEHQLPRDGGERDEGRLLADALEQVELADRLGIDYVWEVEHHFLKLLATNVLPRFAERADQRERDKAERLAPAVEQALARRAPPRAPPAAQCFRAAGRQWPNAPVMCQ